MDKKKSEGVHFMKKFLTRLKMTKGKSEIVEKENVDVENENKQLFVLPKINSNNIMMFSNQLQELLEYVQNIKEVTFYTYDYPSRLNSKLEKEALELRNLFRDVRAAAIDIDRLKKQRSAVKKEKKLVNKKLDSLREEEIKELESIIHAYAKPLHSKWESIKNTQKPEVLENFMNEITGKQRAMEVLEELITRRLNKITKKSISSLAVKKNISSIATNSKLRNTNPFLPDISKPLRSTPDRDILRARRRKQKEIRDDKKRLNNENSGLDLQLVPLDDEFDDLPLRSARTPPIVNIEYNSDEDGLSLTSSDYVIENFMQSVNNENQPELQNEMRNVLQALFGEIRHLPQIGLTGRNRHNNSGNDLRSPRNASH